MAEKQQKLFYRLHEVIKEQWNKVKNNITSVEYNMNLSENRNCVGFLMMPCLSRGKELSSLKNTKDFIGLMTNYHCQYLLKISEVN